MIYAWISTLSWAGTTILLRSLVSRVDSFLANGLRVTLALLVVLPLALASQGVAGFRSLTPETIALLVGGVILGGALGDGLYLTALKDIGVGRAFPILNSFPLFTYLFSLLLLDAHPSWQMAAGLTLVLSGVYLVARPHKHIGPTEEALDRRVLVRGLALTVIAAACWGLDSVLLSMGLRHAHFTVATALRMPVTAALSLAVAGARGKLVGIAHIERRNWLLLILTGCWGAGVGGSLTVASVAAIGPTLTSIINATAPLFAVPLSAIFLHERPTRYTLIGTLLVVAGVILVLL